MIGLLILSQLVGARSELKKQTYLANPYAETALFYVVLYGLVGMFVIPVKFGIKVFKDMPWAGVFYFFMMLVAALALPLLYFSIAFLVSIAVFFAEREKIERSLRGTRTLVYEIDEETGEVIRVIEE